MKDYQESQFQVLEYKIQDISANSESPNIIFAGFILGIAGLGHVQNRCHLRLGQVGVFPQIPQPADECPFPHQ